MMDALTCEQHYIFLAWLKWSLFYLLYIVYSTLLGSKQSYVLYIDS